MPSSYLVPFRSQNYLHQIRLPTDLSLIPESVREYLEGYEIRTGPGVQDIDAEFLSRTLPISELPASDQIAYRSFIDSGERTRVPGRVRDKNWARCAGH